VFRIVVVMPLSIGSRISAMGKSELLFLLRIRFVERGPHCIYKGTADEIFKLRYNGNAVLLQNQTACFRF